MVKKGVNIRKKPTADSTKMGTAQQGDRLIVTDAYYTGKWHQINYNGEICYVSANYCDLEAVEKPAESVQADRANTEIKTSAISVQVDEVIEAKLDQYIAEFELTEECKDVIVRYLPDIDNFDRIERDAIRSFSIFTNDGTRYLLAVMEDKTPACLQSSEKDYKARTRYYDKTEE